MNRKSGEEKQEYHSRYSRSQMKKMFARGGIERLRLGTSNVEADLPPCPSNSHTMAKKNNFKKVTELKQLLALSKTHCVFSESADRSLIFKLYSEGCALFTHFPICVSEINITQALYISRA